LKQIKSNRIFSIIYPLLFYFAVYQLGASFLADFFAAKYGQLICLLIAALFCIIPIYIIYRSVPKLIPEPIRSKKMVIKYFLWIIGIVLLGILFNIILTQSGIIYKSQGFESASRTLSDGSFELKLLCNCLVIPILEELLIRGIIAGQLCLWYGPLPAVLLSSFCFGILHNNIVQFIYALIMGLLLGLMYVKNKRLLLCIIAHCLINYTAIIFS